MHRITIWFMTQLCWQNKHQMKVLAATGRKVKIRKKQVAFGKNLTILRVMGYEGEFQNPEL